MRALLLLAFLALAGGCRPRDLTFASVPWGSGAEEVSKGMAERGFSFLSVVNERGDHLYAGTYAGRRAVLVARMAEGRLAKVEIGLQPEAGEERLAAFASVEEFLAAEYGGERGTVRIDEAGDAEWREPPPGAPRRSVWSRTTPEGESYLILEDRPELAIVVSFESPAWHREYLRRRSP